MIEKPTIFITDTVMSNEHYGVVGIILPNEPAKLMYTVTKYGVNNSSGRYSDIMRYALTMACALNLEEFKIVCGDRFFFINQKVAVEFEDGIINMIKSLIENDIKISIEPGSRYELFGWAAMRSALHCGETYTPGEIRTLIVNYYAEELKYSNKQKELDEKEAFLLRQKKIYNNLAITQQGNIEYNDKKVWCDCIGSEENILENYGSLIVEKHQSMIIGFPEKNIIKCMKCGGIKQQKSFIGYCSKCGHAYNYYKWNDVTGCSKCGKSFID